MSLLFYWSLNANVWQPAESCAAAGGGGGAPQPHPPPRRLCSLVQRNPRNNNQLSGGVYAQPLACAADCLSNFIPWPVRGEIKYANQVLDICRFLLKFPWRAPLPRRKLLLPFKSVNDFRFIRKKKNPIYLFFSFTLGSFPCFSGFILLLFLSFSFSLFLSRLVLGKQLMKQNRL